MKMARGEVSKRIAVMMTKISGKTYLTEHAKAIARAIKDEEADWDVSGALENRPKGIELDKRKAEFANKRLETSSAACGQLLDHNDITIFKKAFVAEKRERGLLK